MSTFDISRLKQLDVCGEALRMLNHGPLVIVSASDGKESDAMPAAWCCNLDLNPTKITVVLAKEHRTRQIIERTGWMIVQIPNASIVRETLAAGSVSANDDPEKITHTGIRFFDPKDEGRPFVEGCDGWMVLKVIPEPEMSKKYDLFITEVTEAWSDTRVFDGHRWKFDEAGDEFRTLHYVAGGHFLKIGEAIDVEV